VCEALIFFMGAFREEKRRLARLGGEKKVPKNSAIRSTREGRTKARPKVVGEKKTRASQDVRL